MAAKKYQHARMRHTRQVRCMESSAKTASLAWIYLGLVIFFKVTEERSSEDDYNSRDG